MPPSEFVFRELAERPKLSSTWGIARLLACPFCRELYSKGEAVVCPSCEIPLVDLNSLPLSAEATAEEALEAQDPPTDRRLGFFFLRRGRGLVPLLGLFGLGLFFSPWVNLTRIDPVSLSAFDLARGNAGFLWGGGIGWFLLIPLVLSRRTVNELRGIRVIAATFPLLTFAEAVLLLARPPTGHRYLSYGLEYTWGLYLSLFVSLLCAVAATRLGGRLTDLRDLVFDPKAVSRGRRRPNDALH